MRGTATHSRHARSQPLAPHEIDFGRGQFERRHEPVGKPPARAALRYSSGTHALGGAHRALGIGRALAVGPAELAALADIGSW